MIVPSFTHRRVLAIYPASRGFGYVVIESPTKLIDWGVKATRQKKEEKTLAKLSELIKHYQPQTLVFEDCRKSRRCRRVQELLEAVSAMAQRKGLKTRRFSMDRVRKVFATFGATTKHQIAHVIALQIPNLAVWLPRHRKPWMSEDYRMGIFDAAALALTCFYSRPV